MSIDRASASIALFKGGSLKKVITDIEREIVGYDANKVGHIATARSIDNNFIDYALEIKRLSSQIDVVVHAAGIIKSLPNILKPGEVVESVSLGAGNTGRKFDLETNMRIAEYKFINWQGGSESVRQNGIFKDFFELAEYVTKKEKYLYVLDTEIPLKFFNGRRSINSVLSSHPALRNQLMNIYGDSLKIVRDYYMIKKEDVMVVDVSPYIEKDQ